MFNKTSVYFILNFIHQETNSLAEILSPFKRSLVIRQIIYYLATENEIVINKTLKTLLFFSFISIFIAKPQPVQALQFILNNGNSSAIYNDNSSAGYYGFNDWQVDNQKLLTETGLFYRVGDTGTAQTLDTLTSSISSVNSNSATVTYTNTNFNINLELSLSDSGSTLNQIATVNNTSGSALDFELYSYFDLVTSNGNGGDTVEINSSSYTAIQSGDRDTITTTVTENNPNYTARRGEVDAIDLTDDTLLQKLQLLSGNSLQLDNDLGAIADPNNPVSFAYQWNYSLANGESFAVDLSSSTGNVVAVPFELSPNLGILLSGIFGGYCYLKRKMK